MNSMNMFNIVGRLTKDPELKQLANGSKVTNITVACDRNYKDREGNNITDFLKFSLWDKNAERLCEYSKKGSLIQLDGYNTTKQIEIGNEKREILYPVVNNYKHLANSKNQIEENLKNEIINEMEK